ncbi:g9055 [Coccomyxa elongata]
MSLQADQAQSLVEGVSWAGSFPMLRGGVVTFSLKPTQPFCISVRPEPSFAAEGLDQEGGWVGVLVSMDSAHMVTGCKAGVQVMPASDISAKAATPSGYQAERWLSYWVSFDPDSGILKYGIGHHMEETTLITYSLPASMSCLFRTTPKLVCLHGYTAGPVERRSIFEAKLCTLDGRQAATVEFARCPLIANPPPLVLDSSRLTLLDLGRRAYLPSSDLPPACQVLYQHLSQPCIDLDWSPEGGSCRLVDAIRHSLHTPGALLHTRCQEKAAQCALGVPAKQSYLRVSVGVPSGSSPGIPYVLEIWPSGHFSPVHNHGNAFGIVRILHGSITARTFNKHLTCEGPLQEAVLNKGDITWFSPNWYQTHQLENHTGDFCCTVQGFQYADDDDLHWPYMQFKGPSGRLLDFLPVSDFSFNDMREALLAEYAAATAAEAAATTCCRRTQQEMGGITPVEGTFDHIIGIDAPVPRCQQRSGRIIEIAAAAGGMPACRRGLARQMTPDSPLDATQALGSLLLTGNATADVSALTSQPSVITLL